MSDCFWTDLTPNLQQNCGSGGCLPALPEPTLDSEIDLSLMPGVVLSGLYQTTPNFGSNTYFGADAADNIEFDESGRLSLTYGVTRGQRFFTNVSNIIPGNTRSISHIRYEDASYSLSDTIIKAGAASVYAYGFISPGNTAESPAIEGVDNVDSVLVQWVFGDPSGITVPINYGTPAPQLGLSAQGELAAAAAVSSPNRLVVNIRARVIVVFDAGPLIPGYYRDVSSTSGSIELEIGASSSNTIRVEVAAEEGFNGEIYFDGEWHPIESDDGSLVSVTADRGSGGESVIRLWSYGAEFAGRVAILLCS